MLWTFHDRGWQRIILRAAWGPRRVTSKRRYGEIVDAYPDAVTAATGLWIQWLKLGLLEWMLWRWKVAVPDTKAHARITEAVGDLSPQAVPTPAIELTAEEIADMIDRRAQLRAARDFAAADAIRDRLTAAGVLVSDHPIREMGRRKETGHD